MSPGGPSGEADFVGEAAARRCGEIYSRSAPKQIEYWTRIGRIAEENPDLPYAFIKDMLLGMKEASGEELGAYKFG